MARKSPTKKAEPVSFDPALPITTKSRMYNRIIQGKFGPTQRCWMSREEVEDSDYRGEFSLRSMDVSHPIKLYHVPYEVLDETIAGLPPDQRNTQIIFYESPPEHRKTIQGELCRDPELYFEYTRVAKPMRFAFDEERLVAKGLTAKILLQQHLLPSDYDDLMDLLDTYPGHVIEFSAFNCCVGTIPGRRMIVWEVRLY